MASYTTLALTNTDPEFYPTLGPYLANREVTKSIGDNPHDDAGTVWIVAYHGNDIAGFIAYHARNRGVVHTESCYTAEGHDKARTVLVKAVIKAVAPSPITATVRNKYVPIYQKLGFTELPGRYKNFTKLVRREKNDQ